MLTDNTDLSTELYREFCLDAAGNEYSVILSHGGSLDSPSRYMLEDGTPVVREQGGMFRILSTDTIILRREAPDAQT